MATRTNFRKTDFIPQKALNDTSLGRKLIITVDGPSASGKGTLARKLAERLNFAYLDTGALYRAVALAVLELGNDPTTYAKNVEPALEIIKKNLTPELLANPALRTPEVSDAASKVAALPEVRLELLDYQRRFAKFPPYGMGGVVLDGRDIGTVVCPEADFKFFVTADVDTRAKRRFEELRRTYDDVTLEDVVKDLQARDQRDRLRPMSPTRPAPEAYILDNTSLTPAETVEEVIAVMRSKFLEQSDDEAAVKKSPYSAI